jgi:2-polyprenyl-6-methoxyphenol hydroxylase-like FAD-dependent oxidoreductase
VSGVRTAEGEELRADLVVDCCGRRSASPGWLEALGGRRPDEELEDSGFIYLGRHFRARDGVTPRDFGPALLEWGSVSTLTLPADNGTWSVTVVGRSSDRVILGFRDVQRWERLVRSLPPVAPWLEGEPIEDGIVTMSKIEDRHREYVPGGSPVATGLVAVADAWACTNPSLGRGASIGMMHAQSLRDTLRQVGPDRPGELAEAFADATASIVEPWYAATVSFDRQRLAEMAAIAQGHTYTNDDPGFELGKAMAVASGRDAGVLRAFLSVVNVLETPNQAMARPGVMEKVIELGAGWRDEPQIGPDRKELVAMATD